jgi:hypothetical protein
MADSVTHHHERRKRERFNIRYSVTIKSPQGILSGETRNVGVSGAMITCSSKEPLFPGTTFDLTIHPPSDSPVETSARGVGSSVAEFPHHSLIYWVRVCFTR